MAVVCLAGYPSLLQAGRPEIALQGAFIYPRADLSFEESIITWGQIAIRHQVTEKISWNLLGDATGPTITRPQGVRIYSGGLQLQLTPKLNLALGRNALWNSLHSTRFDGMQISILPKSTAMWKTLTFYAGVVPVTELHNDLGDDNAIVSGAILKRVKNTLYYTLQVWSNEMGGKRRFFIGESRVYRGHTLKGPLPLRITQMTDFAYDLNNSALEKLRLRSQIRFSMRLGAFVQYRYSGSLTFAPYPWSEDALEPRQALSTGIDVKLTRASKVRASLNQRLGKGSGTYVDVRYILGGLQFAWMSHSQTTYGGQVLQVSGQHAMAKNLRIGGYIGNNMYTLYERNDAGIEDAERSTLGGSLWIQGFIGKHINYRVFAQFTRNRYFEQDGRIGAQVGYAL